jgi:hypothetical protein
MLRVRLKAISAQAAGRRMAGAEARCSTRLRTLLRLLLRRRRLRLAGAHLLSRRAFGLKWQALSLVLGGCTSE